MSRPLLFVGDIHLGRVPKGLPPDRGLSPVGAWNRAVDEAIRLDVQAVLLAGDVVDHDDDRIEAYGALAHGVERLTDAGIRVLGVAGNHDHILLPRLADRVPGFHLLGRDGRWERLELDGVDVLGWSFPTRTYRGDPLAAPGLDLALGSRRAGVPAVGLLHADLDAPSSPYGPTRRADLRRLGLAAVLLGHIHRPDDLRGGAPIGYLGSLVGLDPSETGPRGPVLVHLDDGVRVERRCLGPHVYVQAEVDLGAHPATGDESASHFAEWQRSALRGALAAIADDLPPAVVVGATVTWRGRTSSRRALASFLADPQAAKLHLLGHEVVVVAARDETQPDVDLDALARLDNPLGHVARLLVDLRAGVAHGPLATAVERAHEPWDRLDEAVTPPPPAREVLVQAATQLLDELLANRAQGGGYP